MICTIARAALSRNPATTSSPDQVQPAQAVGEVGDGPEDPQAGRRAHQPAQRGRAVQAGRRPDRGRLGEDCLGVVGVDQVGEDAREHRPRGPRARAAEPGSPAEGRAAPTPRPRASRPSKRERALEQRHLARRRSSQADRRPAGTRPRPGPAGTTRPPRQTRACRPGPPRRSGRRSHGRSPPGFFCRRFTRHHSGSVRLRSWCRILTVHRSGHAQAHHRLHGPIPIPGLSRPGSPWRPLRRFQRASS